MVAGRERLDDRALERRDRPVEQGQAGRAGMPGRPAELVAAGLHRGPREAVGEGLLVLGQDVDRVATGGADDRGQEPAPVERDHDERRLERDRAQRVDGDPERAPPSSAVTTVTPVTKWPITARNRSGSTSVHASIGGSVGAIPKAARADAYNLAMTDRSQPATRVERDSMGEMEVPADALYGASTQRAVLNFPISGQRFPRRFIRALALIKQAAAETNAELGLLDADVADGDRRGGRATSPTAPTTTSSRSTSTRPARAPRPTRT